MDNRFAHPRLGACHLVFYRVPPDAWMQGAERLVLASDRDARSLIRISSIFQVRDITIDRILVKTWKESAGIDQWLICNGLIEPRPVGFSKCPPWTDAAPVHRWTQDALALLMPLRTAGEKLYQEQCWEWQRKWAEWMERLYPKKQENAR